MNYRKTKITNLIIFLFIFSISINTIYAQIAVFSPDTLYMGKIPLSSSNVRPLNIYNIDANNLEISSIQTDNDVFSILNNPAPISLGWGQSIIFEVEFSPNAIGPIEAEISVASNTTNGVTIIPVTGEGLPNSPIYFERIFGPVEGSSLRSLQQTSDEGYILVGSIPNQDDDEISDIYIVKTDEFGKTEWTNIVVSCIRCNFDHH